MFKDILGPLEKKHIRLKNAFFMNKTSSKEIMRKTNFSTAKVRKIRETTK